MAFRLRKDAEVWFRNISEQAPIETKFDLYYLCLMLGFATGRSSRGTESSEFVESFVVAYKPVQRLIIGLFLITEITRSGLDLSEKDAVSGIFDELVDPASPNNLTEKGMSKMNEYASGGFDYLAEQFEAKPHHVEDFLISLTDLIRKAVDSNKHWNAFSGSQSTQQ